jgi:hypothetical protein
MPEMGLNSEGEVQAPLLHKAHDPTKTVEVTLLSRRVLSTSGSPQGEG